MEIKKILEHNMQLLVKEEIISTKEVSEFFNVARQTVYYWIGGSPKLEFLLWIQQKTGITIEELCKVSFNKETLLQRILNRYKIEEKPTDLLEESPKDTSIEMRLLRITKEIEDLKNRVEILEMRSGPYFRKKT